MSSTLNYFRARNIQKNSKSRKDMLLKRLPKQTCLKPSSFDSLSKPHQREVFPPPSVISHSILPLFMAFYKHHLLQFLIIIFKTTSPLHQMTKLSIDWPSTYTSFSRQEDELSMASSEEVYRPNRNSKKNKLWVKNRKKSIKTSKFNISLWTLAQNTTYKEFLIENAKLFDQNRQGRKILKINVMMSRLIKSRSADQCRSHHQKMMKYHRSIPQIIVHIEGLQKEIIGSNGKEEEVDSLQGVLKKTKLIDFNDYEGEMRFRPDDDDLLEMFLTFSS